MTGSGSDVVDDVVVRVEQAGNDPAVAKGQWYPAGPPVLPGEDREQFVARMRHPTHSPYRHVRLAECAVSEHLECIGAVRPDYGGCECPCHRDRPPLLAVQWKARRHLAAFHSLPITTCGRVLAAALKGIRAGDIRELEDLRVAVERAYDSPIPLVFALDVARSLRSATEADAPEMATLLHRLVEEHTDTFDPGPEPTASVEEALANVDAALGPYWARVQARRPVGAGRYLWWLVAAALAAAVAFVLTGSTGMAGVAAGVAVLVTVLLGHVARGARDVELWHWRASLLGLDVARELVDVKGLPGRRPTGMPDDVEAVDGDRLE